MKFIISIIIGLILGFVFGIISSGWLSYSDYKNGQIDAILGKIQVELVKYPNGETKWEFKKGVSSPYIKKD